jgi:hypothetical protein
MRAVAVGTLPAMTRQHLLWVVAAVAVLFGAAPAAAGGKEPLRQDVVTGFIDQTVCTDEGCTVQPLVVDARSGPSGEAATGTVTVQGGLQGTVTCLAVDGNRATIGFEVAPGLPLHGLISVSDNDAAGQPDEILLAASAGPAPEVCPETMPSGTAATGDLDVRDVLPGPTSKRACFGGGWQHFGFTNQGRCIASIP